MEELTGSRTDATVVTKKVHLAFATHSDRGGGGGGSGGSRVIYG